MKRHRKCIILPSLCSLLHPSFLHHWFLSFANNTRNLLNRQLPLSHLDLDHQSWLVATVLVNLNQSILTTIRLQALPLKRPIAVINLQLPLPLVLEPG
jgi:hypothetical protein